MMTEIALMLDGERRLSMRLDDNFLVGVNMVCLEFVEMKQQVVALMDPGRRLCLAVSRYGRIDFSVRPGENATRCFIKKNATRC